MISDDATPQARLDQHWKDVRLILKEAEQRRRSLPLTALHDKILKLCSLEGWGDLDNSAVVRAYSSGKIRIDQVLDVDFT
jgi:3-hydroxyisobutyrate dehydrogenase-like beta-hydroxyacid dehydrogenase